MTTHAQHTHGHAEHARPEHTEGRHTGGHSHRHYGEAMLNVEDALERILRHFNPLEAEQTPLLGAIGQVLAQDALANHDIPPLDNSAMDGYALQAADVHGASADTPVNTQRLRRNRRRRASQRRSNPRARNPHHDRRARPRWRRRRSPLRRHRRDAAPRRRHTPQRNRHPISGLRRRRHPPPPVRTSAKANASCKQAQCCAPQKSAYSPRSATTP